MDIQFISENSYSLVGYITKYVTKADKSHLSNDDFGFDDSIKSKLWKYAYLSLKYREIGAYEACDRWLVDELYEFSDTFTFVPTFLPQNRTRIMKDFKDLKEADSNSTDIFKKDMLSTYYPERPDNLENMSLKDFAAEYQRAYSSEKDKSCIKLKGDNGYIKSRGKKKALVHHPQFDPYENPEKYYYSLLLLFVPWRKEADLLGTCTTYKEAFLAWSR